VYFKSVLFELLRRKEVIEEKNSLTQWCLDIYIDTILFYDILAVRLLLIKDFVLLALGKVNLFLTTMAVVSYFRICCMWEIICFTTFYGRCPCVT